MAVTSGWDRVAERYHDLARIAAFRRVVTAMLRLVATLRQDPRLGSVEPSVSLGSLRLQPAGSARCVMVTRLESEPDAFEVSFVDFPLEYSETATVGEAEVVATIVEYLARIEDDERTSGRG
jgi:hypothetical protein